MTPPKKSKTAPGAPLAPVEVIPEPVILHIDRTPARTFEEAWRRQMTVLRGLRAQGGPWPLVESSHQRALSSERYPASMMLYLYARSVDPRFIGDGARRAALRAAILDEAISQRVAVRTPWFEVQTDVYTRVKAYRPHHAIWDKSTADGGST